MKKSLCYCFAVLTVVMFSAATSMAANPILTSLKAQGVNIKVMDDASLDTVRGTALIWNQPHPSVVWGLKTHHVTYKGFGSYVDYRSYNYIGSGYNSNAQLFVFQGTTYLVGGDQWLADQTSAPNTWNAAYAVGAEYHYQHLDPNTGNPTGAAFRETGWNRPITTFSW